MLLKLLYQAGAYPFDDFEEEDGQLIAVWTIPTAGVIPIVLFLRGSGHALAALQTELKRLGRVLQRHHNKQAVGIENWTYEIQVECADAVSRLIDRKMTERTREEITVMENSFVFVPWFDPPEHLKAAYGNPFTGALIPETGVRMPGMGESVEEWDALRGVNTSFDPPADGPTAERPRRMRLEAFRPLSLDTPADDEGDENTEDVEEAIEEVGVEEVEEVVTADPPAPRARRGRGRA